MAAPTARAQAESDYLIKLLLVGDSGVGKSSLILQFSVGSFTTIGFDFKIRTVELDGKLIKLQIWDTAGHKCFRTIATGAMGILLVYDVTDESSFNNIRNWIKNIEQHASDNLSKILIGNKADMDESKRAVPTSKGQALAKEYGIQFFETSAKTNQNVEQVFFSIARDIKQRLSEADPKHEQGRRAMARSWSKLEQPLERSQELANSIREKCSDKMPVIGEKAKANADAVFSSKDEDWQKIGSDFVKEFYERLDNAPEHLHRLYSSRCEVSWFINDISYVMKSPKEVQRLMATERHLGEFCIENVVIQKNKHSVQVVVNGIHQFNRCSKFFQSFALHHRKRSILSDVLHVVADVSPFKFKVKLASTQAAMTKENDSNSKVTAVGAVENSEVLLVYNESCLHHVPPDETHHENPNRITSILAALEKDGVLGRVVSEGSEPANRKYLRAVHTEKYLDELIDKLPLSAEELKSCPYISKSDEDMYSSSGSKDAVYLAAGAVMKACQSVARGDFKKSFALVRPPGHHARSDHAEGFCYVNNAAAGAKHLIELGMRKVFLVDFDVHHGNGSQYIFYEDNSVLVFSIHCKSTGFPKNSKDKKLSQAHTAIGDGKGKGYNINVPLDFFGDADLLYVIDQVLAPLVSLFKPDAILVSAGFDAAADDPLGQCEVTHRCFGTITKKLVELGKGKLIMCLEGGYNIDLLGDCVSHCLRALLGDDDACLSEEELRCMKEPSQDTKGTVRKLKKFVKHQWDLFNT